MLVDSPPANRIADDPEVGRIEISDDDIENSLGDPTNASSIGGSKLALTWHGYS